MLKKDHNNFFLINWLGELGVEMHGRQPEKKASVGLMQKFPVQTLSEHVEKVHVGDRTVTRVEAGQPERAAGGLLRRSHSYSQQLEGTTRTFQ